MSIVCNEAPCWWANCDHCGAGDNSDHVRSYHYETEAELLEALAEQDWHVERNVDGTVATVVCFTCADEAKEEEETL